MKELMVILTITFLVVYILIIAWYHDNALKVPNIPETESEKRCKRIKEKYEWLKSNMGE